jgi:hypothetical protein
MCGTGTEYTVTGNITPSINGVYKIYDPSCYGGFDGNTCWEIVRTQAGGSLDCSSVTFGSNYGSCSACIPPTPTPTATPDQTPYWVNITTQCYGCDVYNIQEDQNPNSGTYNTTRQGSLVASNSTDCGGCCGQSTTQNWVNVSTECDGCNLYHVQEQQNGCAPDYLGRRRGDLISSNSTDCGGCCGQSTTPDWQNTGGTECDNDAHILYYVQIDQNPCSSTYNTTQRGGVAEYNSVTCGYIPPNNYYSVYQSCSVGSNYYVYAGGTINIGTIYINDVGDCAIKVGDFIDTSGFYPVHFSSYSASVCPDCV